MSNFFIGSYSQNAWVVYGEGTREKKEILAAIGAKWNPNLNKELTGGIGKGWIIPKSRYHTENLLRDMIEAHKDASPRSSASSSASSSDSFNFAETFDKLFAILTEVSKKLDALDARVAKIENMMG